MNFEETAAVDIAEKYEPKNREHYTRSRYKIPADKITDEIVSEIKSMKDMRYTFESINVYRSYDNKNTYDLSTSASKEIK